jgi:hypothetical protein
VHDYFARHGFVSVQVDIRGTGRSEGQLPERECPGKAGRRITGHRLAG